MEDTFERIDFKDAVEVKKAWKTCLPAKLLDDQLEEDKKLYKTDKDKVAFLTRRFATLSYVNHPNWEKIISKVCWEIIEKNDGELTKKFLEIGLHNSLYDFIQHIFYFEIVRKIMLKQEKVCILGENPSSVHDVDKLHPIMLAAYAEKFQDGKDTSLWKVCVQHHTEINPHHQGNGIWHNGDCNEFKIPKESCSHCEEQRNMALIEMICDKVSRKLQKEHNGVVCEEMWNVDPNFFKGLPEVWLDKAYKIINKLKTSWNVKAKDDIYK